ncbi:hypothetical protein C8J56DRAFT_850536 [Mycena floridula]|nr:hypothetical protein C8J56DRAFT_850536 [Mycena floridula]
MDVSAVRAEIKQWEREFKSQNGREPSVQDIRDNPQIAAKYKVYKKLSKPAVAPAPSGSQKPSAKPELLPKPRDVQRPAPLSSFNPFSPQKNKGKQKEAASNGRLLPNPFSTPTKSRPRREPSPDLFAPQPLFQPIPPFSPPNNAALRARKRLRGDSVSPSPQKRPRVGAMLTLNGGSSSDEDDLDHAAAHSSFIDDSPVKAPVGSKSFRFLFQDPKLTEARPTAASKSTAAETNQGVERKAKLSTKIATNGDWLQSRNGPKSSLHPRKETSPTEEFAERASVKRSFPEPGITETSFPDIPLMPPSPPSPDLLSNGNQKAKPKPNPSRKKAKVLDDEEGEEDEEDEDMNKMVRLVHRGPVHGNQSDPDISLPAVHGTGSSRQHVIEGTFEVSLPDKLRDLLALSASDEQARKSEDARVMAGLLYGRREGHYDPVKGEIWDVGEDNLDDEITNEAGEEEEWEGEPVPWEVGEL